VHGYLRLAVEDVENVQLSTDVDAHEAIRRFERSAEVPPVRQAVASLTFIVVNQRLAKRLAGVVENVQRAHLGVGSAGLVNARAACGQRHRSEMERVGAE